MLKTLPPLVAFAAVGVLAFLWVGSRNEIRRLEAQATAARAEAVKSDEAHRLELARVNVARAVEAEELNRRGNYLADALGEALAKLKIKSKIIATGTGTTGPVQAGGAASSCGPAPATTAGSTPSLPAVGPVCLLAEGEDGEITVSGAALRTEAGNVVLTAEAQAFRLNPRVKLFGGPLTLEADYLSPQVPGRGPGWGSGLALTVGRNGWAVGPVIASPPLSLWRFRLEPSAALTLGSGGEFQAVGQIIGRWQ